MNSRLRTEPIGSCGSGNFSFLLRREKLLQYIDRSVASTEIDGRSSINIDVKQQQRQK